MDKKKERERIKKAMLKDLKALEKNPNAELKNFTKIMKKYKTRENLVKVLEEDEVYLRAFEVALDKLLKKD
jgi:heme oxygenase